MSEPSELDGESAGAIEKGVRQTALLDQPAPQALLDASSYELSISCGPYRDCAMEASSAVAGGTKQRVRFADPLCSTAPIAETAIVGEAFQHYSPAHPAHPDGIGCWFLFHYHAVKSSLHARDGFSQEFHLSVMQGLAKGTAMKVKLVARLRTFLSQAVAGTAVALLPARMQYDFNKATAGIVQQASQGLENILPLSTIKIIRRECFARDGLRTQSVSVQINGSVQHVVAIDDNITSGASMAAARELLRSALGMDVQLSFVALTRTCCLSTPHRHPDA